MWTDDYSYRQYANYVTTVGAKASVWPIRTDFKFQQGSAGFELTLQLLDYGTIQRFKAETEGWHGGIKGRIFSSVLNNWRPLAQYQLWYKSRIESEYQRGHREGVMRHADA